LCQPLLIIQILHFIEAPKDEDGGLAFGLTLIGIFIIIDITQNLFWVQAKLIQSVLGVKCSSGVTSLIYEK